MRNITQMETHEIASNFYSAFAKGDAETMTSLYADAVEFEDPAFGKLKGSEAKMMWQMLIERSKGNLKVSYEVSETTKNTAKVNWTAVYPFSKTGRMVTNHIEATLVIENGRIIQHTDHFNLWKWSRQAMGWKGYLLGWTPFFRKKLQQQTRKMLQQYMGHQPLS